MSKRNQKGRNINGVVLLDKTSGGSSNHALQKVKRLFGANKAGHTGSLDPLASGLLPICLGQATKVAQFLLEDEPLCVLPVTFIEQGSQVFGCIIKIS